MLLFRRNNRIWREYPVCKASTAVSDQTKWYDKRMLTKAYSVPRNFSWIENYQLLMRTSPYVIWSRKLREPTRHNTRQYDTTRGQHDTTQANTIQHEYNTTQYDTTRVKHKTTRVIIRYNTSKHGLTRVQWSSAAKIGLLLHIFCYWTAIYFLNFF